MGISFSWGDILDETLIQEGIVLVCGFGIMFLYVAMMLGKPNMIEQRVSIYYAHTHSSMIN